MKIDKMIHAGLALAFVFITTGVGHLVNEKHFYEAAAVTAIGSVLVLVIAWVFSKAESFFDDNKKD